MKVTISRSAILAGLPADLRLAVAVVLDGMGMGYCATPYPFLRRTEVRP
jgi:hypothetical protein